MTGLLAFLNEYRRIPAGDLIEVTDAGDEWWTCQVPHLGAVGVYVRRRRYVGKLTWELRPED